MSPVMSRRPSASARPSSRGSGASFSLSTATPALWGSLMRDDDDDEDEDDDDDVTDASA